MQPTSTAILDDKVKLTLVTTEAEFLALEQDWTQLYNQSQDRRNIFLSFDFNLIWYRNFFALSESDLQIIVGRQQGKLVYILPLLKRQKFGITQLRWIGDPVSQYGAILYHPSVNIHLTMKQAVSFIDRTLGADLVILPAILTQSDLAKSLEAVGIHGYGDHRAPVIDLSTFNTIDAYWQSRSKSANKQRRRLRRKLVSEHGEVTFSLIESQDAQAVALVRRALQLKQQNLKDSNIYSSAFATGKMEDMFVDLAQQRYPGLLISVLRCKDDIIALEIGFQQEDYYVSHLGVYDHSYRKYGAGKLQIEDTINALFDRGITMIDLLPPDDGYKYQIATTVHHVTDYAIAFTAKGHLYRSTILQRLRPMAKDIKNKLATQKLPKPVKGLLSKISTSKKTRS